MGVFVRKVPTKSGATAVQIVEKRGRRFVSVRNVGSAHSPEELTMLLQLAHETLHPAQDGLWDEPVAGEADEGEAGRAQDALRGHERLRVTGTYSQVLWDALTQAWAFIGLPAASMEDRVFRDVSLARVVEPTSKRESRRVLEDLGVEPPSTSAILRMVRRAEREGYREKISDACFRYARVEQASLLLYDVTSLHMEVHQEDDFRKPGFSKERRLEPQIIVGLLVDTTGFPLMVQSFEGNKAETLTILPVVTAFAKRHRLPRLTIVADAGMLSVKNLAALEDAGFDFIVGSKLTKMPYSIEEHFRAHPGSELADQQIFTQRHIEGLKDDLRERTLVFQYRAKRAALDTRNIDAQVARAQAIIDGDKPAKATRFLTVSGAKRALNQDLIDQVRSRAGLKGYITNLAITGPDPVMTPADVIAAYHRLFEVEASFRLTKHDLAARPVHHRRREAIDGHLTTVFAGLAVARHVQGMTGVTIREFVRQLRPIRTARITIGGHTATIPPEIPETAQHLLDALNPRV